MVVVQPSEERDAGLLHMFSGCMVGPPGTQTHCVSLGIGDPMGSRARVIPLGLRSEYPGSGHCNLHECGAVMGTSHRQRNVV